MNHEGHEVHEEMVLRIPNFVSFVYFVVHLFTHHGVTNREGSAGGGAGGRGFSSDSSAWLKSALQKGFDAPSGMGRARATAAAVRAASMRPSPASTCAI